MRMKILGPHKRCKMRIHSLRFEIFGNVNIVFWSTMPRHTIHWQYKCLFAFPYTCPLDNITSLKRIDCFFFLKLTQKYYTYSANKQLFVVYTELISCLWCYLLIDPASRSETNTVTQKRDCPQVKSRHFLFLQNALKFFFFIKRQRANILY